jgi:hypothetical protein
VSSTCAKAGIQGFILPLMNFSATFGRQEIDIPPPPKTGETAQQEG